MYLWGVYTRTVELEHQPQLTLDFAQKDLEYKTQVRADLDGAMRELSFTNEYFDKLKLDGMEWSSKRK